MNNKIFLTALATTLAIPICVAPNVEASTIKFSDVTSKYKYYKEISEMAQLGIVKGTNGKFNPAQNVTKAHAAAFIDRPLKLHNIQVKQTQIIELKDVSKKNANYEAIKKLVNAGAISAKNGKFEPNKPLTRGEMAELLVDAFSLDTWTYYMVQNHPLTDVSSRLNYYVGILYNFGITTGSNGKFNENAPLKTCYPRFIRYIASSNVLFRIGTEKENL